MTWTSGVGSVGVYQNYWNQPGAVSAPEKKSDIYVEPVKVDSLPSREDLISYSIKAFERFKKVWDFDNFWKRGNTCDACISLSEGLLAQKSNDPDVKKILDTVQEMLEKNLHYYNLYEHDDKWADDFGWWGVMGLNAYQLLKKLGNDKLAVKYFDLSRNCWAYMLEHAYDESMDSKPVAQGCRNNAADESPDDGVKNTVVNASLLLLSIRLYQYSEAEGQPDRKPYLDMACRQWLWFSNWFALKDNDYLKTFNGNAALVGERPLALDSDYQNLSHPNWSQGWIWTGDQGPLIRGLLGLLSLKDKLTKDLNPNFDKEVKEILQKLVRGVQEGLIGNSDSIFHEPPCTSSYITYGTDYLGGRGILVRYMGVQDIKDLLGVDFTTNILQTTQAIWSTRDTDSDQFKPEFSTDQQSQDYFKQFNNLLGYSDNVCWNLDPSDFKLVAAVSQAVGLDFLGAALSANNS